MTTTADIKAEYRQWAEQASIPPFYHPAWLDLLCGAHKWDIVLSRDKNGVITGLWPFSISKKLGLTLLLNPRMTSYLGPFILSHEQRHEIYAQLYRQLPSFAMLEQKLHLSNSDPRALKELGFSTIQSPTYVLDLKQQEATLLQGFKGGTRRRVKKGNRRLSRVTGEHAAFAGLMHTELKATLGKQLPERATLEQLFDLLESRQWGQVMTARNEGQLLAGLAVVKDGDDGVFLCSAVNEAGKKQGAMSYLLWHAMLWSKAQGLRQFDFEGSSVASIAAFFMSFGGKEREVTTIRKVNNPLLRAYLAMKGY